MKITNPNEDFLDERYMRRCLQLARNGEESVAPNPMVGAVIVCDGHIIGEGYHQKYGGPHAEVNAIRSVKDTSLLVRSTLYVSLEPCAHYGKTPPCADLIVEKHIPRVVIGCCDPFAKVDGLGIQKLQDANIEVKVGVLEEECQTLNKRFIAQHTHHRPHITLKWAQSEDGYLDRMRNDRDKQAPTLLSTPTTQALMHRLRAQSDAILVGARTAYLDNPSLTTRSWYGPNPLRLVIDLRGSLPDSLKIFDQKAPTRVYVSEGLVPEYSGKAEIVEVHPDLILEQIMADLQNLNVQSLIVEGGAVTLKRFLEQDLWDEVRIETAPTRLGEGIKAPDFSAHSPYKTETVDGNKIQYFLP